MDHLIPTKTLTPLISERIIIREPVMEKLNSGLKKGCSLFLVTSLAGSGKTTLVSQWVKESKLLAAWVSLDTGDNDFSRFWEYIIASLQMIDTNIGRIVMPALQSIEKLLKQTVVNAVIRDVSACGRSIILVLDDYHVIRNSDIHASLEYLLEHLPINLRLVIISRERPPLSLSRLRASFGVTDVSFSELRFTKSEINCLLNNYLCIYLEKDDVRRLEERTEGWIAGIQMAALTLETLDLGKRHDFICRFTGEDSFIFDYMAEVVLQKQSRKLREFFLKTSIVECFCASLCDEILGIKGSQALLQKLENSNLFLFSIDHRREWFRYHNLFSDFLKRQLMLSVSQEEISKLYSAVIRWYERNDMIHEAVSYAMMSEQYDCASELIERNLWSTYYRSETQLVFRWLKELPVNYVESSPLLSAAYANCLLLANREMIKQSEIRALIEYWLGNAEKNQDKYGSDISKSRECGLLTHYIRKLRIFYELFLESDLEGVAKMAVSALERLPENELMFRCAMMYALGRAYFLTGDTKAAVKAFESVRQIGSESGDLLNVSAAIDHLADIMYRSGYLMKATDICREGIAYIAGLSDGYTVPFSGTIYIVLGKILFESGKLAEAEDSIKKGIELLNYTNAGQHQQWGYILLAYIYQAYRRTSLAFQAVNEAICFWIQGNDEVAAHRVRLCLLAADSDIVLIKDAEQWLKEQNLNFTDDRKPLQPDVIHYTAIRVLIDMYRMKLVKPAYPWSTLMSYLERQQPCAAASGYITWEIEVLLLKTKIMYVQGDTDRSMQFFQRALELGEKSGYLGVFINEGQQILPLLCTAMKQRIKPRFIQLLMESFSDLLQVEYESLINYRKEGILHEPLSKRELEILRLIAIGHTNREISERLQITIHTVKTHIYHIFEKFCVRNRTQAIATARELELIT